MIHGRVRRKQIFGAFRADAVGDFGAIDLFLPGVGKGLIHVAGNDEGIGGLPGLWSVFQQGKFERQLVAVLFDEMIDAASVGVEERARGGVHQAEVAIGGTAEAHGSESLVDVEGGWTENLG